MTLRTNPSYNPEPTEKDLANMQPPSGGAGGSQGVNGYGGADSKSAPPPPPPPPADETAPAEGNRVYELMMQMVEDHGQREEVRGYDAWMVVGHLENLGHWASDVRNLTPAQMESMVTEMLEFAEKFGDNDEGYRLAAALLSTIAQAMENNPEMAKSLSVQTRQRLVELAERLDAAAPGRLDILLEEADNLENFQKNGRPVSDWNNQKNAGDIDFNKGRFSDAQTATDGLRAVMGAEFVPATATAEDIERSAQPLIDAYNDLTDTEQGSLMAELRAMAMNNPLMALVLAIIETSEDQQQSIANVMSDASFDLSEQNLAVLQFNLDKASTLLEMGWGIFDIVKEISDTTAGGWGR